MIRSSRTANSCGSCSARKSDKARPRRKRLIQHVTAISREEFPDAQVTGFFVLLTRLIESMLGDQWLTFILSTGGIFLMMLIAFRSIPVAVITLIPNALPIMVVTGLLGWSGLKINMGGAMIAAVSMGLAVDSSAHYITAFRSFRAKGNRSTRPCARCIKAWAGPWCFRPWP